ncbi:polyisoprenoid-binding protein [Gluconacetobacter azotocaptans]|uniref:Polyisoprenoid-binding protein n=2 Tax=Gluconacetobacter azotocaptans TaxID=142834 RepID=A0A7W4PER3_9PROT|nr:polyisoprenoid-binding protein [Gluconacetobacter azotocaptans]MBM9401945.1 polyisoprenoid-binding protein [Gluconacetobacter azotocaptans]
MRMKKTFPVGAAVVLGLVAILSGAQAATPPHDVQAGSYKVDAAHTQIIFSTLHFGFTLYSGIFSGVTGTLQLDPAHPTAARLDITVPVDSVTTTSAKLTGELKGTDWLDAGTYPTATFTSTNVTPTGLGSATIAGKLTLHGVTKPVVLHAHYVDAGVNPMDKAYTVGFQGTATIRRSDFGVKTYVPMIGDEVTLTIAGAFEKQG